MTIDPSSPGFVSFPRARAVEGLVNGYAAAAHITPSVVMGVIAQESQFNPSAYNPGDPSWGLMQMLLPTARALGYQGSGQGLYDPETSIRLGVTYLRDRIAAHGGDVWAGVSAYNNGHGRRGADGRFSNQPYVDAVMRYAALFPSSSGGGASLVGTVALVYVGWWSLQHLRGG